MGATWAFVFLWLPKKWSHQKWRDAVGVQTPIWEPSPNPTHGMTAEECEAARELSIEVSKFALPTTNVH